jgi:hypothetical protein
MDRIGFGPGNASESYPVYLVNPCSKTNLRISYDVMQRKWPHHRRVIFRCNLTGINRRDRMGFGRGKLLKISCLSCKSLLKNELTNFSDAI